MKKIILLSAGIAMMATAASAQKSKLQDASDDLRDNNYKRAITEIDEAVANDATKTNPRAWYLRGMAYLNKAIDSTVKSPDAADIATASFTKALELKPDYDADEINNPLYSTAIIAFNKGVASYGAKDYSGAYTSFSKVSQIYNAGGAKRWTADKNNSKAFQALLLNAKTNAAYAAVNNQQYDIAGPALEDLKNAQTTKDSNIYQTLVEVYLKQKNSDKMMSTLSDARQQFPNNKYFRDQELNYYINSGKSDELITKLEAAVATDPNNDELLFNLGNSYQKVAFPSDPATGKDLPQSGNWMASYDKAEKTYQKLLTVSPNSPDYNYNTGIIYYKRAASINKQLMDMKAGTAAEKKSYDNLLAERNSYFDKALPYFEKSYSTLDSRSGTLTAGEKETYRSAMIGLREIYSRKNNKAKSDELSAKIKTTN